MPSNTRNLQRANSYASCLDLFAKISKPRNKDWGENERPLGDARQYHYRVERGPYHFDVILYSTVMARFHKPDEDGSYRVMYTRDSRTTSSQFMHNVVRVGHVMEYRDTEGTLRRVPLGEGTFATDLWFDAGGRLDVARSHHSQAFKPVVSEEFKAWRKEFTANLSNICFLLEQTVPETVATHTPDANEGHPFDSTGSLYALNGWDGETLNAPVIDTLRDYYKRATEALMDKRAYKSTPSGFSWRQKKLTDYADPTPQEVTRSVMARLCTGRWAPTKYDKAPLPMFPKAPDELPKNWTF